jgi:hypothetical protein
MDGIKESCDGQNGQCRAKASVTTKSGLRLCRDCAVEYDGGFATPQDENRVRWFRESLYDSDDGT